MKVNQQHWDLLEFPPFLFLFCCYFNANFVGAPELPSTPLILEGKIVVSEVVAYLSSYYAILLNDTSTFCPSNAEVSSYGISLFLFNQSSTYFIGTFLSVALSDLLPKTKKGKLSASLGFAFTRKSCLQSARFSKLFALVISYTSTQASAPL